MQQESSRVEYRNPFRIVKAEEFDHDYQRLAQLFRAPWSTTAFEGRECDFARRKRMWEVDDPAFTVLARSTET